VFSATTDRQSASGKYVLSRADEDIDSDDADDSGWTVWLRELMMWRAAMGIRIKKASVGGALVEVPFGSNQNHADSVFGGSLSVAGIVSG